MLDLLLGSACLFLPPQVQAGIVGGTFVFNAIRRRRKHRRQQMNNDDSIRNGNEVQLEWSSVTCRLKSKEGLDRLLLDNLRGTAKPGRILAIFGPSGLIDPETVMPQVLIKLFNPWITGILITGVLAAIISTANSLLILSATELSENLIKPLQKNSDNKTSSLNQSRIITALLSVTALVVAYIANALETDSIYVLVGYVWAGIGCTFSVIIMLTLFWKRFHGKAALITMISGMVFTILWITTGMEKVITSRILTFLVALIIAVLCTYLIKTKKK